MSSPTCSVFVFAFVAISIFMLRITKCVRIHILRTSILRIFVHIRKKNLYLAILFIGSMNLDEFGTKPKSSREYDHLDNL